MQRYLRCSMLFLAIAAGCGGSDANPRLVPVKGKVTFNGQPVKQGTVGFIAQDGKQTFSALIENGEYSLSASQSAKGALPGEYRVSINAWETLPTMDAEGHPVEGKAAIPKKYFETATSELTATVPAKGGTVDFILKP